MGVRELASRLAGVSLFSGLSRREREAVVRAAKEVNHPEGKVLARQGDRGIGFFLILEGTARVTVNGRARATLAPGDFYGEIALLDQGVRSATVTATSPVKLLGVTAWVFRGLVQQYPSIALKMLEVVAHRLRSASRDIRA